MRPWQWAALLGIAIGAFLAYANALGNSFCYDENIVILRNGNVQDPGRILALWTDSYWGSAVADDVDSSGYRPLTIFTYHLDHRIGGNDPFAFHMTSVLLHVLCTSLMLLVLFRLGFEAAVSVSAAALFALHAIHTEAVAQIVGRGELLACACILGALLLHIGAFRPEASARRRWISVTLAAGLLLLGLLGKESAVGFYALVLATDVVLYGRGLLRARWKAYLAYAAPLAAFLALRLALFGRAFPTHAIHFVDNPIVSLHPVLRPLAALLVLGKSLWLLLVPAALSADYGYAELPVTRFWTSGLFWFGLMGLAALIWCLRISRRSPPITWGILAMLLAYLPVSNILFPIQTILGERILYIPSIGFCVLAAASLTRAPRSAAWTALSLVLAFNAIRTPLRNRDWHDDLTLFEATARVSTRSVRVLNNHGNVLMARGDLDGAEKEYLAALALFPAYDDAEVNLAAVLMQKGKIPEARRRIEAVLSRSPTHPVALSNLKLLGRLPQGPPASSSPPPGPARTP